MTSKRNENRQSTVKGIIANPITQTFEQFEIKTPYTRSTVKAVEFAREQLEITDPQIMVSVTEVVPDELKKVAYDAQLIIENSAGTYDNKERAEDDVTENETVLAYTMHGYSGQLWMIDNEGEYTTVFFADESPLKFGKVDTRAFLKMAGEEVYGCKVIGIHNEERQELKRYAIVSNDKLHLCEKPQS